MAVRQPNTWWLLPGAAALVAAVVFDLRAGQLSGGIADGATGAAFYLAGALAYLARPASRSAWLLLMTATALAVGKAAGDAASAAATANAQLSHAWAVAMLLDGCGWTVAAFGIALFVTYPDGLYQRRYELWVVRGMFIALGPLLVLHVLGSARLTENQFGWLPIDAPSPMYIPALAPIGAVAGAVIDSSNVVVIPAIVLLVLRFRRFGRAQREQIKWPLFAIGVAAISSVVMFIEPAPPAIPLWLGAIQYVGTYSVLPAGLALGIVTYRGVDIEDVIRRSVVYGALWVAIGIFYVLVAAAFGIAVGQRVPLALAVVLTIAVTLIFQPARRWLERLADRVVYGRRLSGYELISQLGSRLQLSVPAEDVAGTVARAVHHGLGASWVRVILHQPQPTTVATLGTVRGSAGLTAPLMHDNRVIGVIECGTKGEGRFDQADQDLLNLLGRQAALALRNAQLTAELNDRLTELAASRVRLVQAEDAGRRRLERDLHDGVQQQLVALLARLGLAHKQLKADRASAEMTLQESQLDAQHALEAVQELARGIHPAILTDRGLVEAIEERASRMTTSVTVDADGVGRSTRFPVELEGAGYFFVSEALANILKHATASSVSVRLRRREGGLWIDVEDDGRGFEAGAVRLSGLRGLIDRIEALGGRLDIASQAGRGTTLTAYLPLPAGADA